MPIIDDIAAEFDEMFNGGSNGDGNEPQGNETQEGNGDSATTSTQNPNAAAPSEGENGGEAGPAQSDNEEAGSTPAPSNNEEGETQAPSPSPTQNPDVQAALTNALATIQAQQEELKKLREAGEARAKPEPEKEKDIFTQDPAELYQFQIPQALYNALYSEESTPEQRMQALQGYAQGIAILTHKKVMETLGGFVKENFNAVPRVVEYLMNQRGIQNQQQSSIKEAFYKEFPDLQRPELTELLKSMIRQVQQETGAKTWTPALQKTVGSRMRSLLKAFATPAKVQKPSQVAPTGVKPAPQVQTQDPNSGEAIADLFSSMFK